MPRAKSLADVVARRATDTITLRRKVAGSGHTTLDPISVQIDFTTTGSIRAASVLQSAGLMAESTAIEIICAHDADIRVADTFAHSGALYKIEWVGPAGQGAHGAAYRLAIAAAQKPPRAR